MGFTSVETLQDNRQRNTRRATCMEHKTNTNGFDHQLKNLNFHTIKSPDCTGLDVTHKSAFDVPGSTASKSQLVNSKTA